LHYKLLNTTQDTPAARCIQAWQDAWITRFQTGSRFPKPSKPNKKRLAGIDEQGAAAPGPKYLVGLNLKLTSMDLAEFVSEQIPIMSAPASA